MIWLLNANSNGIIKKKYINTIHNHKSHIILETDYGYIIGIIFNNPVNGLLHKNYYYLFLTFYPNFSISPLALSPTI